MRDWQSRPRAKREPMERFQEKTIPANNGKGCIFWRGPLNSAGYGRLSIGGKWFMAHRWIYEKAVGPIGKGLLVLHACDEPLCVNVEHLSIGTQLDNMSDAASKGRLSWQKNPRIQCYRGHELTDDNVYVDPKGARRCCACRAENKQRWKDRHTKAA